MRVLLSIPCIAATMRRRGLSLGALPGLTHRQGFDGLELSTRLLDRYADETLDELRLRCERHGLAVALSTDADLTRPDAGGSAVVERAVRSADRLGCRVVRFSVGGQSFSIHRLLTRGAPRRERAGRATIDAPPERGGVLSAAVGSRAVRSLAHRVRVAQAPPRDRPEIAGVVAALARVVPQLERSRIDLAVENHWGVSSRPEWIAAIVEAVGSPRVGVCLDFHNFPRRVDRYAAVERLAPLAVHVHAHTRRFDARGEEPTVDYRRCFDLLRRADYRRDVTAEYQGPGDELAGARRTRALIERYA